MLTYYYFIYYLVILIVIVIIIIIIIIIIITPQIVSSMIKTCMDIIQNRSWGKAMDDLLTSFLYFTESS